MKPTKAEILAEIEHLAKQLAEGSLPRSQRLMALEQLKGLGQDLELFDDTP